MYYAVTLTYVNAWPSTQRAPITVNLTLIEPAATPAVARDQAEQRLAELEPGGHEGDVRVTDVSVCPLEAYLQWVSK